MKHIGSMRYDVLTSWVVEELLSLLNLPSSASPADLDARHGWFLCETCSPDWEIDNPWRKPLHHYVSEHHYKRMPSWKLLSQEETNTLNPTEPQDRPESRGWYCNHCAHFLTRYETLPFGSRQQCGTKAEVLAHLAKE
ncbi:hypothetical protein EIP86_009044 [Pleurotus ostreatoroseus]|nr:hypothetical protein EIP86_009044 [Pleurotus ostreatoroseus]